MYALSPNRSRNVVEKVESDWGNQRREYSSFQNHFEKKKEKKKKAIPSGLGVLKARFSSKILPEWVEIL